MSQLLPERRTGTAPERWEPFSELEQVTERMRRMLDQTFGGFAWPSPLTERAGWSPLVDIEETDDAYVVEAEVPGVNREDVNVELVGNDLSITGEIKERERKGLIRRQTRRTGRFDYRVSLPNQVDAGKIDASLENGVLTVRVPKSERAQRRRIEVKA
ncbi:MAG: Hsp20/alpha crystallin family protein [Actinomycetota bacterium]|nr:Hsp20/alpha crystallin family protein [Actinomycetota bacterium]